MQMLNAEAQTPCHVAAYLMSPCLATPYGEPLRFEEMFCLRRYGVLDAAVYALTSTLAHNDYYRAPGPATFPANGCNCNTVLYSMLAACGTCQGESYISCVFPRLNS